MKSLNSLLKTTVTAAFALALATVATRSLAEEPAAAKVKPYTLQTCPVSGEKLGEMGSPYVFTNSNREIKLCCKGCLSKFTNEPAAYIKKIETAEAEAAKAPAATHQHKH